MPRIINTFAQENPLAKAIQSLSQTMFGDTLAPAIKRQQLNDMQRQQLADETFARTLGAGQDGMVDLRKLAEYGALGGRKADDTALWNVFLKGNELGPRDPAVTRAYSGAAKYGDSAENLDLNRKNTFDMNAADNSTSRANNEADNVWRMLFNTADNATSRVNNAATNDTSRFNNAADNVQKTDEFNRKPIEALIDGQPGFVPQGEAAPSIVPQNLWDRQIKQESGGNQSAISPKGATGVAQVMPATGPEAAQLAGLLWDPNRFYNDRDYNEALGKAYMEEQLRVFGSYDKALAAYNAGPSRTSKAIAKYGDNWLAVMPRETQDYVKSILGNADGWSAAPQQMAQQGGGLRQGGAGPAMPQQPMAQQRPLIQPIPGKADLNLTQQFQQALDAARVMMPDATPEQWRQMAMQQVLKSRSKGITYTDSDGNTFQIGGDDTGGPTAATDTAFQAKDAAYGDFLTLADKTMAIASDPQNAPLFGPAGNLRHMTQNAAAMVSALAQQFGANDVEDFVAKTRQKAIADGADPRVIMDLLTFDPRLPEIDSMSKVLLYKMAETLGQKGQGASDKDVQMAKGAVGDPLSWSTTQQDYVTRLKTAISVVQDFDNNNRDRLKQPRRQRADAPPPTAGGTGAGQESQYVVGPDGKLMKVR